MYSLYVTGRNKDFSRRGRNKGRAIILCFTLKLIHFLYWIFTSLSTHFDRGYDNYFIVQAQLHDISPGHIILATGQPVFALYMLSI